MATQDPVEVDARGLYCPLPVLRLAAAFEKMPPGSRARLYATDPASAVDVEAFCREGKGTLLSKSEDCGTLIFEIEKG